MIKKNAKYFVVNISEIFLVNNNILYTQRHFQIQYFWENIRHKILFFTKYLQKNRLSSV